METKQTTESSGAEERSASDKNSGVDDAMYASLRDQFYELRSEQLNHRSDFLNWWLVVMTVIFTAIPIVTGIAAYFTYDKFRDMESQAKGHLEEAKKHASQAEGYASESEKYLEEIIILKKTADQHVSELTSEDFKNLDNAEKIKKIIEGVELDEDSPLEEKAMAAAYRLQHDDNFTGAIEKWKLIANIADGEKDDLAARAWFSIGYLHMEKREWIDALSAFKKAIDLNEVFANAYNNRGVVNFFLGQYEFDRGNEKSAVGRYKSALADYTKTINLKRDGDLSLPYSNRGLVNFALGEYELTQGNVALALDYYKSAREDHTQAINQNPDYGAAYKNRSIVNFTLGEYESARGNAGLAHEHYESAFEDYDSALDLNPGDAGTYANRGQAQIKLGKIKEAKLDLQTALGLATQQEKGNLATEMEQTIQALNDMEPSKVEVN